MTVMRSAGPPRHPGPLRWLWYALSGRLPMAFREWALYDLTCPTWPLRHLARLLVLLVPLAGVLIALLPGPLGIRAAGVAIGSLVGLLFTFVFLEDSTDRHATKFGYPSGTPQAAREQRAREKRARERRELYQRDEYLPNLHQHNGHRSGLDQRGTQPFRPEAPKEGQR
jgi:hypothetical protein